ncbi:MAG: aldo/keto reductase [Thermoanaerobacteraceae bacterium]|nr:aldo/keto reductase [Thermoanaerobacteraceae bacterium]
MIYKEIKNLGIKISSLGFGAMRLPMVEKEDGKKYVEEDKAIEVIHRAFELGVNYIDTAPYYCEHQSEAVVGKALKGWRDKVYVSTKNPVKDYKPSKDEFKRWLEQSLKRLDVDYIDFYHFWGLNLDAYNTHVNVSDGPLEAALEARQEGLIKHISFSFHDVPENMIKLIDTGNFETVLCQYNLLDRKNEEAIAYAHEKGMGVFIMGPVGGGRLGEPSPVIQSLIPGGVRSTAEMALRFVMANPDVSCALSGMSTIEMVEENAAVASIEGTLSDEEIQKVKAMMDENAKLADLYCTGCEYCMPCPENVKIPDILRLMNYYRVYGLKDYAIREYSKIKNESRDVYYCNDCGKCIDVCPQKLNVLEELKGVARILDPEFIG